MIDKRNIIFFLLDIVQQSQIYIGMREYIKNYKESKLVIIYFAT